MQPFRFLPHSVTSDVAFEAFGETQGDLFSNAARATFSVMCEVERVEQKEERTIKLEAQTLEDLLFNFLNELIFLKDRDSMLFSKFEVNINTLYPSSESRAESRESREVQDDSSRPVRQAQGRRARTIRITAKIAGEAIDPARHKLGVDVKAVTKHNFAVKHERGTYKATVVLDI